MQRNDEQWFVSLFTGQWSHSVYGVAGIAIVYLSAVFIGESCCESRRKVVVIQVVFVVDDWLYGDVSGVR